MGCEFICKYPSARDSISILPPKKPKSVARLSSSLIISILLIIKHIARISAVDPATIQSVSESLELTYGVIVDCGSSGTRAHIFEWSSALNYPELLNHVEPMRDAQGHPVTMKIKPGLSSLDENPSQASDYMRPIVDFILSKIPEDGQPSTAIYILGTAGMRLLDGDTQLNIMNDIADDLKANYKFAQVKAKVIPGSYEGLYQWITVNSKAKRFIDSSADPETTGTFGVIEMGGASVQVSFRVDLGVWSQIRRYLGRKSAAWRIFNHHVVEPRISREDKHHNYRIFSVSFLGLGSNSARDAYLDLLIRSSYTHRYNKHKQGTRLDPTKYPAAGSTLSLEDPCLPRGANQIVEKPLRIFDMTSKKTVGFTLDDDEPAFKVNLMGTGQYFKCKMLVRVLLARARAEKLNCKPQQACPMTLLGTKFVPFDYIDFLGLAEFYYTSKEMTDISGEYLRDKVVDKTRKICSSNYHDLVAEYPEANEQDPDRATLECFKLIWIDSFLTEGLRMTPGDGNFDTIKQIRGDSLDWTLGAVLDNSLEIERAADASNNG